MENITLTRIYSKIEELGHRMEQKMEELEELIESEHIYPINNKETISKLRKIDEEIASGKRKLMSEGEFFSKY